MTTATPARVQDLQAIALLGDPTRRRLYEWVSSQARSVGREEAARAVGITRSLATFHLDRLATGGLLEAGYQRLTGRSGPGAGRPARVYRRASREFTVALPERRYDVAAELFATALDTVAGGAPPPALSEAAHRAGERVGAAAGRGRGAGGARLLNVLANAGYEPEIDATGTIRLRNCPFDALVESHRPLVCGTNLSFGEGIVAGAAARGCRAVADPQAGYCCVAFATRPASDVTGEERVTA